MKFKKKKRKEKNSRAAMVVPPPAQIISTIWAKAKNKNKAKMLRIFSLEICPFVRINQ
jgi:hypothetical protein